MAGPTTLVITRTDSNTDILPIPTAISYSDYIQQIVKGGGYFQSGTTIWIAYSLVKTIQAQ